MKNELNRTSKLLPLKDMLCMIKFNNLLNVIGADTISPDIKLVNFMRLVSGDLSDIGAAISRGCNIRSNYDLHRTSFLFDDDAICYTVVPQMKEIFGVKVELIDITQLPSGKLEVAYRIIFNEDLNRYTSKPISITKNTKGINVNVFKNEIDADAVCISMNRLTGI